MARIYISYRKYDSSHDEIEAILATLINAYGEENIRLSTAPNEIDLLEVSAELSHYSVLLVLIGTRWSNMVDYDGRRVIDNPFDYHFAEIQAALTSKRHRVIIMLTDGASRPSAEMLPEGIRALAHASVLSYTNNADFISQLEATLKKMPLKQVASRATGSRPSPTLSPRRPMSLRNLGIIIGVTIFVGWLVFVISNANKGIWETIDTSATQSARSQTLVAVRRQSTIIAQTLRAVQATTTPRSPQLASMTPYPLTSDQLVPISRTTIGRLHPLATYPITGEYLAFAPQSRVLVTSMGADFTYYALHDMEAVQQKSTVDIAGSLPIRDLAFNADASALAVLRSGDHATLVIYDTAHNQPREAYENFRGTLPLDIDVQGDTLYLPTGERIAISTGELLNNLHQADGDFVTEMNNLVYRSIENRLYRTNREMWEFEAPISALTTLHDSNGAVLLIASGQTLYLTRGNTSSFDDEIEFSAAITAVTSNQAGDLIVVGLENGTVAIFRYGLLTVNLRNNFQMPYAIQDIAFSHDDTVLAISHNQRVSFYGVVGN